MFQTTNQMISNELFTICMLHVVLFAILKKDTSPANNGLSFFGQSAQVQLPGSPPCSPSKFGGRQHSFVNLPHE